MHYDSLLMCLPHDRSDFKTKIFKAIIEEAERQDLWEECRQIYIDRENPERGKDARDFYERNKAEMLRGSKVLWQDGKPLWELMTWKWDNGRKACNTECMNYSINAN